MCWSGSNQSRKTAMKNIVCYKILKKDKKEDDKYFSYYYDFQYKFGELYENSLYFYPMRHVRDNESIIMINDGFHSYDYISIFEKIRAFTNTIGFAVFYKTINSGIYYKHNYMLSLVECIIPKGSIYYENEYGLLVSDRIIVKKEIDCI